jgi:hypothetical protein
MNDTQVKSAIDLCVNVFEPLRKHVGQPIKINSGYRSLDVNKRIGGVNSSQHCKAEAFDLELHSRDLFIWAINNLDFDQAIYEFGDDQNAGWFHFSYRKGKNRKQALRGIKVNGKTQYIPFK